MVKYENEFAKIELLADAKVIKLSWSGFVPGEIYKEALIKALEIAKQHGITNWLTDARYVKVVKLENQDWAMNEWTPQAVLAGCYRKQAVVLPDDVFGKASANRMLSIIEKQEIEFSNFNSEKSALEWLLTGVHA